MKRIVGVSILAVFVVGCADSGQGGAGQAEVGAGASEVNIAEPGVAAGPGTTPVVSTGAVSETPARPIPVPEGSEATPNSATTPAPNAPVVESSSDSNEQGAQRSPEPLTGDDANPDSVNPRQ